MLFESRCKKKMKLSLSLTVQQVLLSTSFLLHAFYLPTLTLSLRLFLSQTGCPSGSSNCVSNTILDFLLNLLLHQSRASAFYCMSIYTVAQTKALLDLLGSFLFLVHPKVPSVYLQHLTVLSNFSLVHQMFACLRLPNSYEEALTLKMMLLRQEVVRR